MHGESEANEARRDLIYGASCRLRSLIFGKVQEEEQHGGKALENTLSGSKVNDTAHFGCYSSCTLLCVLAAYYEHTRPHPADIV